MKIEELLHKYIDGEILEEEIDQRIDEAEWSNMPKGWTKESVKKFAKSLAGKDGTSHGFFDKCVAKMKGNIDDPEAFCATVKDTVWGTTYWRGKGKTKAEIRKQGGSDK